MADTFIPVKVTAGNPPRGAGTQPNATFVAQAMRATFAWGSSPGTATLVYVGNAAGVQTGSFLSLTIGSHYFAGICKSDTLNVGSSEGTTRQLQFVDLREFLTWDWTFCAFNKPDVRLVNGVRVKRYKHVLPDDYDILKWTYTNDPIPASQMLSLIFGGPTIGTEWTWDLTGNGQFPGGLMNFPIYDMDCLNGKQLDAVLNDFCNRSGCVFGLFSTVNVPYRLVFTRKGYGPLPTVPDNTDNRRVGVALSGHPTNVRILGGRNLYQVMNVPMQYDWARGWEQFQDPEEFPNDIFHRESDPRTGQPYDAMDNDPDHQIGRQLANARAYSITLREYVDIRGIEEGQPFVDNRKYAGRLRMDMPVILYLSSILFRAFRPADGFALTNAIFSGGGLVANEEVPLTSLDIADKQLCKLFQTDPTDGTIQCDPTQPADGNGFAIVKGYIISADLFNGIKSDQFTLDFFSNARSVWQRVPFQIDDSGEGVRFILFESPVFRSEDMIVDIDGQRVINANCTIDIPEVRAALIFEAERFSYWKGTYPNVSRDTVENIEGLNLEIVVQDGDYTEIPYSNGESSISKADAIGASLLLRQFWYTEGGVKLIWQPGTLISSFGTALSSMVDRIEIVTSPKEGTYETIDYANERQRESFEPERELDRRTQTNSLFPGQAQLRVQVEQFKKGAAGYRELPALVASLRDLVGGGMGVNGGTTTTRFAGDPSALEPMPAGTVIRKRVTQILSDGNRDTLSTIPADITSEDKLFVGVTLRHNEDPNKPFKVQSHGSALARVKGPVELNDAVGLAESADGWEYLVKDGTPSVGRAEQKIADDSIQLIHVNLASGGSAPAQTYKLIDVWDDYLECHTCTPDGLNEGSASVYIAKEWKHRVSLTEEEFLDETHKYSYDDNPDDPNGINPIRHDAVDEDIEDQIISPPWALGEIINAQPAVTGVQADTDDGLVEVTLLITGRSCGWMGPI